MQQLVRVWPAGYTPDNTKVLNDLLCDGWSVIFITKSKEDSSGGFINDYIIEKKEL